MGDAQAYQPQEKRGRKWMVVIGFHQPLVFVRLQAVTQAPVAEGLPQGSLHISARGFASWKVNCQS